MTELVYILYVVPCLIMLVYDYLEIRWRLKQKRPMTPLYWKMAVGTLCPFLNLFMAVCFLMVDLNDFILKIMRR